MPDPPSAHPTAASWATVTVAADHAAGANAVCSAALTGRAEALAWLEATGLPARLVGRDGGVHDVGSWPAG